MYVYDSLAQTCLELWMSSNLRNMGMNLTNFDDVKKYLKKYLKNVIFENWKPKNRKDVLVKSVIFSLVLYLMILFGRNPSNKFNISLFLKTLT